MHRTRMIRTRSKLHNKDIPQTMGEHAPNLSTKTCPVACCNYDQFYNVPVDIFHFSHKKMYKQIYKLFCVS